MSFKKDIPIIDENVIFTGEQKICGGEVVFPLDKNKRYYTAYDDVNKKYWIHTSNENISIFSEVLRDGEIKNPIKVVVDDAIPNGEHNFYVTDNIALVFNKSSSGRCIRIDLNNFTSKVINIPAPDRYYKIVAFSGDVIFSNKWYYDIINDNIEYFPETISNCIYQATVDKLLAISSSGSLVYYDYRNKNIIALNIKNKSWRYYYSWNDYSVYYTKDKRRTFLQVIMFSNNPFNWYKYDLNTKEEILINSPWDFSRIIGSI